MSTSNLREKCRMMCNTGITLLFWASFLVLVLEHSIVHSEDVIEGKVSTTITKEIDENLESVNYREIILSTFLTNFTVLRQSIDFIEDNACRNQCRLILTELEALKAWAVKFYDATGKFPEGVLAGSLYQMGNFGECLDIGIERETPENIRGQYCLSEINVKVPEAYTKENGSVWDTVKESNVAHKEIINKLYWGICVPASCTPEDIQDVINRILSADLSPAQINFTATIPEKLCYKNDVTPIDTLNIIFTCFILFVSLIIVLSTICHAACLTKKTETPNETLTQIVDAFSLISNVKKLLSPIQEENLHLDFISGIRFISMVFIIAGHSVMFVIGGPILNESFWEKATTKVENSIFLNNALLVDTFLFLSGFLFCRLLLGELDRRKSVNFFLLYVFRYIRLTPAYLAVLGLYATWLPNLGSGPLWSTMKIERERCLSSWWANLLYINNYVNTDKICMFQSWYLSVDTQLFILAPLVIYPLWRWKRIGLYILAGVTILSMFIPFIVTLFCNLDPTLLIHLPDVRDITSNDYFKTAYIKTHMRAEGYCFGLVYGYIIYRIQMTGQRLSRNTVKLGWVFGSLSLVVSMCSIKVFYGPRKHFTAIEAAAYASLHRAFWCIGTGWVIVACVAGNAGIIRKFLSWRLFVPFSRLTYSAYLVNGLVVLHSLSTVRSPQYLSFFNLFCTALTHIILSFMGAFLLSVMFESPILGIKRIFLRDGKRASENSREGSNASCS